MLKTFDGFSGADYSYYNAYCCTLTVFGLLVIQPLIISYDGLHDALYLLICLGSETISKYVEVPILNLKTFYFILVNCLHRHYIADIL